MILKVKQLKTKIILLILTSLMVAFTLNSSFEEFLIKFRTYHHYFPGEKVYLHLNKVDFTHGETLWFKAYLVDAINHQTDTISGTLYVDLVDIKKQEIVYRRILKVRNGMAKGDFYFPDSLSSSNYMIRAYTNWMRNFDPAFFYNQKINLYSKDDLKQNWKIIPKVSRFSGQDSVRLYFESHSSFSDSSHLYNYKVCKKNGKPIIAGQTQLNEEGYFSLNFAIASVDSIPEIIVSFYSGYYEDSFRLSLIDKPDIQFFPEGGNMVSSITNSVAFEAHDSEGNPLAIEGQLLDENDKEITRLKSFHEGRGLFFFKPEKGITYRVRIEYRGEEFYYSLPEILPQGIVMSAVKSLHDEINLKFFCKDKLGKCETPFILIGQVRGKVYSAFRIQLQDGLGRVTLPKDIFPTGILQLTLFNDEYKPLAERLVFINHDDFLKLNVKTDKRIYKPREKVTVSVNTIGQDGSPVVANLSASIIDIKQLPYHGKRNIISYLMLSSDIKGTIINPSQYFNNPNNKTKQALDLLMMTHGWRRFKWEDIVEEDYPTFVHRPQKGFEISGQVTRLSRNKPIENANITLSIFSQNPSVLNTTTDLHGRFRFPDLNFYDRTSLIIQTADEKGNNKGMNLNIDSVFHSPTLQIPLRKASTSPYIRNYINKSEERKKIMQTFIRDTSARVLEAVTIKGHRLEADEDKIKIYGKADITLKPDDNDERFFYFTDYLRGRVAGLSIVGSGLNARIMIRAGGGGFLSGNTAGPLFLLDGFPVNLDALNSIPMADIESIDIIKGAGRAIFGSRGAGGVIAVYTKRGQTSEDKVRGITRIKYTGYYVAREFYAPDYTQAKERHTIPDLRSMLYWEPNLLTDSMGTTTFSYFNADPKSEVKIIVEGISEDGTPGYQEVSYEVR